MKVNKHIILIPVYNDWNSLNRLLREIDLNLKQLKGFRNEVLIINDSSTKKIRIKKKKFYFIKKIFLLDLENNRGSQKAIAIGLSFLKKSEKNFIATVMDGDGEDQPKEIIKMVLLAKKFRNFVITSNRKKRKESIFIRLFYHIHLILTFFFTFKWISFGNFTSFHSKNIKNILFKNQSCLAHSASVMRNCKIKRLYAKRGKRYFDNSNLNFIDLIEHSLRINAVFLKRIFFISTVYSFTIFFLIDIFFIKFLLLLSLLIFNFFIIFMSKKHQVKYFYKLDKTKNIKLF